jgi:hypothetical protein
MMLAGSPKFRNAAFVLVSPVNHISARFPLRQEAKLMLKHSVQFG